MSRFLSIENRPDLHFVLRGTHRYRGYYHGNGGSKHYYSSYRYRNKHQRVYYQNNYIRKYRVRQDHSIQSRIRVADKRKQEYKVNPRMTIVSDSICRRVKIPHVINQAVRGLRVGTAYRFINQETGIKFHYGVSL